MVDLVFNLAPRLTARETYAKRPDWLLPAFKDIWRGFNSGFGIGFHGLDRVERVDQKQPALWRRSHDPGHSQTPYFSDCRAIGQLGLFGGRGILLSTWIRLRCLAG